MYSKGVWAYNVYSSMKEKMSVNLFPVYFFPKLAE